MTLEGGIDCEGLLTRRQADGTLVLQPGERPAYQANWDDEGPVVVG